MRPFAFSISKSRRIKKGGNNLENKHSACYRNHNVYPRITSFASSIASVI